MEPAVGQEAVQGKEAITASNSHSFLLRLPQEIQDQIYKLVCGGNLLHFEFTPSVDEDPHKLCHSKCLSDITEDDAQARFFASTSPWFDEVCAHRHLECGPSKVSRNQFACMQRKFTLDLRFLRTCRQIYHTAKIVCYGTNIFSFDSLEVFMKFGMTKSWTSHIRSLRLRIRSGNSSSGPAFPDLFEQVLGKLTGLRSIHIDLEQTFFDGLRTYDKGAEEDSLLTQQLLGFGGRALKAATVVISDARFFDSRFVEMWQVAWDRRSQRHRRWTLTKKQEYAHFLRNALLSTKAEN